MLFLAKASKSKGKHANLLFVTSVIRNRTVRVMRTGTEQVVAMTMLHLTGDIVRIDRTKTQQSTK